MFEKIFLKPGYTCADSLTPVELKVIRSFVAEEISAATNKSIPEEHIEIYHNLIEPSDHIKLASKDARIFSSSKLEYIQNTELVSALRRNIPGFSITNEENGGDPEIYWRIVRPNQKHDVGPLHADAWFWRMGIGEVDEKSIRIKVWVQIAGNEPGFVFIPNSHLFEFDYKSNSINGKNKPVFINNLPEHHLERWPVTLGKGIIFNDRLLHGGATSDLTTRASFEFTFTALREYILDLISSNVKEITT